jgi:hypothetical protein
MCRHHYDAASFFGTNSKFVMLDPAERLVPVQAIEQLKARARHV